MRQHFDLVTLLRVKQIVHQGDVVKPALKRHSARRQNIHLPFKVIAAFRHRVILKQRLELLNPTFRRDNPLPGAGPDNDPSCFCEYAPVGSFRDYRAHSGLHGGLDRLRRTHLGDFRQLGVRLFLRRADVAYESVKGIELVFLKEIRQFRAVFLIDLHSLGRDVNLDVCLDGDKLVAEPDVVPGILKLGLLPRCQFVQMLVYLLDGTVLGDQLAGTDLADPLHSGHIVGRVPADCQHIDDLFRRIDSVLLTDFLDSDDFVVVAGLPRLVLPDVRFDKLPVILVRGHHKDIQPLSGAAFGHRSDHIVGLESLQHQGRDIHRLA